MRRKGGESLRSFVREIGADVFVLTEAVGDIETAAPLWPEAPGMFTPVYKGIGIEVLTSPESTVDCPSATDCRLQM